MTSVDQMGAPVRIIKISENRTLEPDMDALESILLNDSIRDKYVVVISIAGDFRKGKSFLLNFCLRYLQSDCREDWLDQLETPLNGFSWRGGCDRDTTGILMWSQPFFIKRDDGSDVAILLMDTQGIFDTDDTIQDSAKVFAISTLISSIQIFNLMRNLQEDNLQVLDFFTDYGQLVIDCTEECRKPFQKLLFLIRDWPFAFEHSLGFEGGKSFLDKRLAIKPNQRPELQRVRRRLSSCFNEMDCCLLPYPGNKVATDKFFDGNVVDIDNDFVQHLKSFVSVLFDPSYFVIKEICGQLVTARDLFDYIQAYIDVFANESLPEPKNVFDATAEVNNLKALDKVLLIYINKMNEFCGNIENYVQPIALQSKHNELKAEVIEMFDKIPKIGGSDISGPHRERLIKKVNEAYKRFKEYNDIKKKSLAERAKYMMYGGGSVFAAGAAIAMALLRR